MKLKLHLDYHTVWGQNIYVCGSVPELGSWDEAKAVRMFNTSPSDWNLDIEIEEESVVDYRYLIKENEVTTIREWGEPHTLKLEKGRTFDFYDLWQGIPQQKFLYTSGFTQSFFRHQELSKLKYYKKTLLLKVVCPYVKKNQTLILSGSSKHFGDWDVEKALHFEPSQYGEWVLVINGASIKEQESYKLAIYDKEQKKVVHWEEGNNRIIDPIAGVGDIVKGLSLVYYYGWMNWKAGGVSIPVFSLRSNDSFGIGEFSDLKKMVDWAARTNQRIIQILPINDTTITYSWTDSYPYSAISIYALHPIYLGLHEHPLKDEKLNTKYKKKAAELNALKEVDYDGVITLKWAYFKDLFKEKGKATLKTKDYQEFCHHNQEWLFPYACFSYLRDKYKTADFSTWKTFSQYNEDVLKELLETDKKAKENIDLLCFVQYLLHKQLVEVKEYANNNSVILKGDIPIGISRSSVEAWVEPHLFNMDVQTGAPPDDFSYFGQNWGFPTYNWDEMAKDGYQWWIKRFRKMADYFDAYRIDHILGFFRIWEIPFSSIQGLLGYFSPALPMPADEIRSWGMWFDDYRMTNPYIHEHFLDDVFDDYTQEVIEKYMNPIAWQRFELKEFCNTQEKIKEHFKDKDDIKSQQIRDGLFELCNEVLFIHDKREPWKYHPRITAQFTYSYQDLDDQAKMAFNRLYDEYFYRRHTGFWRDQALTKLPTLISSTSMLVCGEDLGMVPESVPSVMHELQILSLEIERMPKIRDMQFNYLGNLPYMSVCATSTHDMAPIRAWWHENKHTTQKYYNEVLWRNGAAPEDCNADLCLQIISNHLNAPSMLVILPLQDWLSIDDNLKRANPEEERINVPAIAQHYWRYRMHLTLEELIEADEFNDKVISMIAASGRE